MCSSPNGPNRNHTTEGESRERLLIGCPGYMRTWPAVTTALQALNERPPETEIVLVQRLSGELVDELYRENVDMAVMLGPLDHDQLASTVVATEELLAAVPADHPLADLESIPVGRLEELPLVLFAHATNPRLYDHYLDMLDRAGVAPRVLEEPGREGSRAAVAAGWGFTLAARSLAETHPMTGVAHRPLTGPSVTVDVHLAWHRDYHPPAVAALLRESGG